jgi:hypothetical protein
VLTVSGDCNITIAKNVRRGGVVDVNYADATTPGLPKSRPVACASTCTVPSIVGGSSSDANAAITAAGLTVGTRTPIMTCEPLNEVLFQSPAANEEVACSSAVNYEFSTFTATVPNILNMSATEANAAIADANLAVGTISYSTSSTVAIDRIMDQDPDADTVVSCNPTSVHYILSSGCFPKADPNYGTWMTVGHPLCWCYPRQCHGDTDNAQNGDTKTGYYYVFGGDLAMVISGWKKAYSGDPNAQTWICADITHKTAGDTKTGYFRVFGDDLGVVIANWKSNPPGDCP